MKSIAAILAFVIGLVLVDFCRIMALQERVRQLETRVAAMEQKAGGMREKR